MRTIITLFTLIAAAHSAYAQSTVAVQYSMNFPMGNTQDFVGDPSFRGATIDYRYHITSEIAVGVSAAWYTFYERKDYDTYTVSDNTLSASGIQYRYLNSMPLLFVGNYYFNTDQKLSPFVGLGIGTTYNRIDNEMGLYDVSVDSWHFTLAPEAGLRYGVGDEVWGYLSVRYNNSFETNELDAQSYLTVNVGVMFLSGGL